MKKFFTYLLFNYNLSSTGTQFQKGIKNQIIDLIIGICYIYFKLPFQNSIPMKNRFSDMHFVFYNLYKWKVIINL